MKRIITNLFAFAIVAMFASACSSDDDIISTGGNDTEVTTRAVSYPYVLELDIFNRWGTKYYTFLVTNADNYVISDRYPFPFYYYDDDITQPRTIADYTQYDLYDEWGRIEFGDNGIRSSVPYYYDIENGIGYYYDIKIGERVAIWASKEKYTLDDLRLHDGDEGYFERVSESFELCYITVLKPHTTITYGMWEPEWQG